MGGFFMRHKFKQFGYYLIIIVLLPYVITVFINGPSITTSSHVDGTYVKVKLDENQMAEDSGGEGNVIELPIEDYCIGIIAKEVLPEYEKEMLKAQAVLVRTDVYRRIEQEGSDTVLNEPFWTQKQMEKAWGVTKYSRYYNKLRNAWRDTEGQVLMYEGKLAKTPFFRLSNGSTRDGKEVLGEEYPYLKIMECPMDIEAEEQIQTVTMEDMDAEVKECDTAGYVLSVQVGKEEVSGEEFRTNYHLASSCFTLQKYNGKLRITTRGVGHGLGMSQNTANQMAKNGREYEEILEEFFEDTDMKEVTDIVLADPSK
jgi:Sporulation protein and related proteins